MSRWVQLSEDVRSKADSGVLRDRLSELRHGEFTCDRCGAAEPAGSSVPAAVQLIVNGSATEMRFGATHASCAKSAVRRAPVVRLPWSGRLAGRRQRAASRPAGSPTPPPAFPGVARLSRVGEPPFRLIESSATRS